MFFDILDANRLKGGVADVMSDLNDLYAARSQLVEDSRSEVQSGGRRGNRSSFTSKNCLISGLDLKLAWFREPLTGSPGALPAAARRCRTSATASAPAWQLPPTAAPPAVTPVRPGLERLFNANGRLSPAAAAACRWSASRRWPTRRDGRAADPVSGARSLPPR